MVQFYAEVLRGVGLRDNNFKPIINNDPSTTSSSWFGDVGFTGTINSDGDLLTITGTDATHGVYKNFGQGLSTTSYPYLVILAKADAARSIDVQVKFVGPTTSTFTINLTTKFQRFTITLPSAKTLTQTVTVKFINQSSSGSNIFDYVYVCQNTPIQLSQKALISSTVTRTSLGADHAELELANKAGKYTASMFGTGGPNALGFGDHLHIYLGQGATAFHVYGGYVELQNPTHPPDTMMLHSRGFGLAALREKVLQVYNGSTPQTIINDVLDSFVNNPAKNGLINDSGANPFTGYQLTRSFVQAIGSSLPLYVSSLNNAYNVLHELADLTVYQGSPAIFFVDPAENLHWVPLGTQGAADWTTDPYPANYAGSIAYGTNIITSTLSRDTESLVNRVHYYGIAQIPGPVDGLSDYSTNGAYQADWATENIGAGETATLSTVTTPLAIGTHANDFNVNNNATGLVPQGGVYYPSGKNLGLDLTKMGSQWSPPLIEFYIRFHGNGASPNPNLWFPLYVYFASSAGNYYGFRLNSPNAPNGDSIFNVYGITQDFWYHVLVPIGPYAGNLFLAAPTPNIIPQPTLTTPPWQFVTGAPSWSSIQYIGFQASSNSIANNATMDVYIDGLRIIGGRYRLAYDNRTVANGRYRDRSEAYYYDPISKDEANIKGFAASELLKLRNGILRGSAIIPLTADILPEQQIRVTDPSANLANQYLRCTSVIHHSSKNAFLTELVLTDDFTNSRPLDRWKLMNVLLEMGENAIFSRQLYDLRTAVLDPTFTPNTDPYT